MQTAEIVLEEWLHNPAEAAKVSRTKDNTIDTKPSSHTYAKLLRNQELILANANQWKLFKMAGLLDKDKNFKDNESVRVNVVEIWRK